MPSSAAGSKLFAADSGNKVVGSLANPDPAAGTLTVDRIIGPAAPYFYNYAFFSGNNKSLALDTMRDILYVGNGTSLLVFYGASMANGDIVTSATIGTFGSTGSLFADTLNDRLYVGDDNVDVKVFSGASMMMSGTPTPRHVTGMTLPIYGVAVDTGANNLLYVSNEGATTHQISVFANADTVTTAGPTRTIIPMVSTTNLPVGGIYLDAGNDRLYVAQGASGAAIMTFDIAHLADGPTAPTKTFTMPVGMLNVVVDTVHDRLYAVGVDGDIYLVENVSTLTTGMATAKAAVPSAGGMLTAVAVNPN